MNQPSYHFELLIAGFGTILAFVIGAFAMWDMSWFPWSMLHSENNSILIALFFLPLIYTTGIVTDRFIDLMLGRWFLPAINQRFFGKDDTAYIRARTLIYVRSESLKSVFEYSRTRIRILRCWMLNSLLIGTTSLIFIFSPPQPTPDLPEAPFCEFVSSHQWSLAFTVLSTTVFSVAVSFYSWRAMTVSECRNLKFQSQLLSEMPSS
jgi:hypothetical protein